MGASLGEKRKVVQDQSLLNTLMSVASYDAQSRFKSNQIRHDCIINCSNYLQLTGSCCKRGVDLERSGKKKSASHDYLHMTDLIDKNRKYNQCVDIF